jgi:hypothetical protein
VFLFDGYPPLPNRFVTRLDRGLLCLSGHRAPF